MTNNHVLAASAATDLKDLNLFSDLIWENIKTIISYIKLLIKKSNVLQINNWWK